MQQFMPSAIADFEHESAPAASGPALGPQLLRYAAAGIIMAVCTLALLHMLL